LERRSAKTDAALEFDAALEIDAPMYNKIERGDHRDEREQITVIAQLLQTDENTFVSLWLADKIIGEKME
jgi:hypothetical protein